MNVAKLFAVNIIIGVAFILLAGCATPVECEVSMSDACAAAVAEQVRAENGGAMCSTDTECEELNEYLYLVDAENTSPTALADALQLKALCESDPEDLLDLQECPR